MRDELKVRDGKGGLLPFRGLEYFGFSIEQIRLWRKQEYELGRSSGLSDFYATNGLCFDCGSDGVQQIGWSEPTEAELPGAYERGLEQLPFYVVCPTCCGIGKADRAMWKKGQPPTES